MKPEPQVSSLLQADVGNICLGDEGNSPAQSQPCGLDASRRSSGLRYGSVCSGIEAATTAWHPLGWRAAFVSEIEAFPRAVLQHRWPRIPLHGDFATIGAGDYHPIDLLVGGTPCQDFSIAGLRAGMAGDRGNLTLQFLTLADRLRPRWLVWENVPGVLSSNGGRDFGSFLGGLGELGYGWAYRTLDAQFFGVAQRRRRVFAVGYAGDWRRAAAVLFERHSLQGHPSPRREAGEGVAGTFSAGAHPGGYNGQDAYNDMLIAHTLKGEGFDASEDGTGRGTPIVPVTFSIMPQNSGKDYKAKPTEVAQPIMAGGPVGGNQGGDYIVQPTAFSFKDSGSDAGEVCPTLRSLGAYGANGGSQMAVAGTVRSHTRPGSNEVGSIVATSAVRRLTPRECERLQGFPDDYTLIPWRKGVAPDGPRYKALGNSMAVPVMAWIGRRIAEVEALQPERIAA